jgi:glycosyltransferase involved in cell wall biosynthesis
MNVVHVVESFAGGTFDFLVDLTNGLQDYKHLIIHSNRPDTPENYTQYFPVDTKFCTWSAGREISPINDLKSLIQLIQILSKIPNIDVLHLHSSKAGFLGRLTAKMLRMSKKVIYTSHGVSFLRTDVSEFKRKIFIYLEKCGSVLGGQIIACSKSEAEIFKQFGINAKYIYNGVKPLYIISRNNILNEKEFIIGTASRITYPKNPILFSQIAELYLSQKNIKFLWVGDGELRDCLTAPNIEITGWLKREQVEQKIRQIDIYLSTSLWEGLPLSVLQAMFLSKPLVLSNCVGNKDLIIQEYNGYLFQSQKEAKYYIDKILFDKNLYKKLSSNSVDLAVSQFSLSNTLNEYDKLYRSIIK